jgi:hypothetical protein
MKNNFIIYLVILISFTTYGQIEGDLLLGLTNTTTAEMNAVNNPIQGSLLYNSDENRVYQFNGTNWDKLVIKEVPTVELKTTNYTLTANDNGSVFTFNSSVNITLTANAGLPVGFNISIYQLGDGQVTIIGGSGVIIKNRLSRFKTAGKDAGAGLICTENNIFHLTGDLKK